MSNYTTALSQDKIQSFIAEKRKYSLNIGDYMSKAWDDISKDWGTTLITGLLFYIASIIAPWMMSGLFIGKYEQRTQNKKMDLGSLFRGFDHGMPILMYLLISIAIIMVLFMVPYVVGLVMIGMAQQSGIFALIGVFFIFLALISIILFSTLFFFAVPFITFGGMDAWPAMKASMDIIKNNFFTTFLYMFVAGIVSGLGLLLCGFGILITIPLVYHAHYHAFQDVFQIEIKDETDEIIEHLV